MPSTPCIPAPPLPPGGPSDWAAALQGNCFTNLQRLGRWVGGTKVLAPGTDPSSYFKPVEPDSLGFGDPPFPPIYVLSHGWAPGYRDAVRAQGGNLLWWSPGAYLKNSDGTRTWASDWAWTPVTAPLNPLFTVNANGVLQSIAAFEPAAIVLAWSWIDDSATDNIDDLFNLTEVYRSEAYTHLNGIRLANALEEAIHSSFWGSGELHILGHSHGSKVATVAALTLQQRGRHVSQLTILDAPESEVTLEHNGANLLGFYLEPMQIAQPTSPRSGGTFVDNYASYFGIGYAGTPNLNQVVEVALDPSKLYSFDDPGDKHSYAAAWYGAAAAGAQSQKQPPLGLAWPPPPQTYLPALNQTWPTGNNQLSQWQLKAGAPIIGDSFTYYTQPLPVTTVSMSGNVKGNAATKLTFGPPAGGGFSVFCGSYYNSAEGYGYGVAVDILWTLPQPGDYLVVTMESPDERVQEVLLVLDGQSSPAGQTSVAINSSVTNFPYLPVDLYIYYFTAQGDTTSRVVLSNFRLVNVGSASGYLHARRLAAAAEKTAKREERAPRTTAVLGPLKA